MFVLGIMMCLVAQHTRAQTLTFSPESSCTISGTSTLAAWTAEVDTIRGQLVLGQGFEQAAAPKAGASIQAASLSIPVQSIRGARGEAMTEKIHRAFKAEQHPHIAFSLTEAQVSQLGENATFEVQARGTLSMAGVSHDISLPLQGRVLPDGSLQFEATHKLNMTDFGIEPPSAMFGQIVCGDEVTIIFKLLAKAGAD